MAVQSTNESINNPLDEINAKDHKEEDNVLWLDDHPDCSVCLQPCLQPVQLPCQHIFCFLCLKGFAYRSKRCALCRAEVHLKYFEKPIVVKVREKGNNDKSEKIVKDEYNWFYEGRNGWWQYDERASTIIEEAFKGEVRSCEILVAGFAYVIDFENMMQYRKSNPARARRVKRDRANVDRKGIAGLKELNKREKESKETSQESNSQLESSNHAEGVDINPTNATSSTHLTPSECPETSNQSELVDEIQEILADQSISENDDTNS